jgi:hypothetical protein
VKVWAPGVVPRSRAPSCSRLASRGMPGYGEVWPACNGTVRWGSLGQGETRRGSSGPARPIEARDGTLGTAALASSGELWSAEAWHAMACHGSRGAARRSTVSPGVAGQGMPALARCGRLDQVWLGRAWSGPAAEARAGKARSGEVGHGKAWSGSIGPDGYGSGCHGLAGQQRLGTGGELRGGRIGKAGLGRSWVAPAAVVSPGLAGYGLARRQRHVMARCGRELVAWHGGNGWAAYGSAGTGSARLGAAWVGSIGMDG